MRKTTLAIAVASVITSGLFAGEYGFRDLLISKKSGFTALDENTTVYMSATPRSIGNYCLINGGNLSRDFTDNLGTEHLVMFDQDVLNKALSMTKDERIAEYAKSNNTPKINSEFAQKESYIGGREYVCQLPTGQTVFKAERHGMALIISHPKENMVDYAFYTIHVGGKDSNFIGNTSRKGTSTDIMAKLNTEYQTYENLFDDWNNGFIDKNKKTKRGQNYELDQTFTFDRKFALTDSLHELAEVQYLCEAKHGNFMKDGKPFREYMKDFYLNGGVINQDTFKGAYVCHSTLNPFTLTLDTFMSLNGDNSRFMMGNALIKKGASSAPTQKKQLQENMWVEEISLAWQAIIQKQTISNRDGLTVETAIYGGKDSNGCDLATLEKRVITTEDPSLIKIFKYKSCNGNISPIN